MQVERYRKNKTIDHFIEIRCRTTKYKARRGEQQKQKLILQRLKYKKQSQKIPNSSAASILDIRATHQNQPHQELPLKKCLEIL